MEKRRKAFPRLDFFPFFFQAESHPPKAILAPLSVKPSLLLSISAS